MISADDVNAAIEVAADADNDAISTAHPGARSISSAKRMSMTFNIVKRFIEAIPEGTTVDEIRDRLDLIEAQRDA